MSLINTNVTVLEVNQNTINKPFEVGYKGDHNAYKLVFSDLVGDGYSVLFWKPMSKHCIAFPLVNNEWLLGNEVLSTSGTLYCQVVKKDESNNFIKHSQVFMLSVNESAPCTQQAFEEVPPNFKIAYDEMVAIIKKVNEALTSGKFNGLSAYELAVKNGFKGTEEEWIESLKYWNSPEFTKLAEQVRADKEHVDTVVAEFDKKANTANTDFDAKVDTANTEFDKKVAKANSAFDKKVTDADTNFTNKVNLANSNFNTKVNQANQSIEANVAQAQTYAEQAETSATNAKTSETNAKQSELNAKNTADYITDSIDKLNELETLFKMQRTGKLYGVKIWKSAVNLTSDLEKTRDNKVLVCEPSTDTVEGRDDYTNIHLFNWNRVNYLRYDDGFAYPVAFEGDVNYQTAGSVDVGNIYQTFYYGLIDNTDYKELIISDSPNALLGLKPWEDAVRADGTVMPYFIKSAYHAVIANDGKLRSQAGLSHAEVSHNQMVTDFQKKGKGYWGEGSNRLTFAQIMLAIKYATKNSQSKFAGCTSYNSQIKASVLRSDKQKYFVVPKINKTSYVVGSCVSVGYPRVSGGKENLDRGYSDLHMIANRVLVTKIADLDDNNVAVYLDCEPFALEEKSVETLKVKPVLSSMPWKTGSTDKVIGKHDGSIVSNTDGKHAYRIQGIEYHIGTWIIASDTVMFFNPDYSKDVYFAKRGVAHSTSDSVIKSTYQKIGTIPNYQTATDWWVGDVNYVSGCWYPYSPLSSGQGYRDKCWAGGAITSGSREYLQCSRIWSSSDAGLATLYCGCWLGYHVWDCACAD